MNTSSVSEKKKKWKEGVTILVIQQIVYTGMRN